MAEQANTDVRGVLHTPPEGRWELRQFEPDPSLAHLAAWCWFVRWDRRGLDPHRQATLPHPSAHVVVEEGAAWLYGPPSRRFERSLAGEGRVVGVRFRPGGVRPLLARTVASIVDARLSASAVPGLDAPALAVAVDREDDPAAAVALVEAALRPLLPADEDPGVALADRAVALLAEDRSLLRVSELARRLDLSERSVHRLFTEYVGLGPAWVVRRYRLHEAAARAAEGGHVDWARLAATLGYSDQAHLVRDFTATIGMSPTRYAAAAHPRAA